MGDIMMAGPFITTVYIRGLPLPIVHLLSFLHPPSFVSTVQVADRQSFFININIIKVSLYPFGFPFRFTRSSSEGLCSQLDFSSSMMRPGLVNKRSTAVLSPIADNPSSLPTNALVPCISNTSEQQQQQQENVLLPSDVVRLRHAGSRVLSDIRGVLKAIGKSQGNQSPDSWLCLNLSLTPYLSGSEASTTLHADELPAETQSLTGGLSPQERVHGRIEPSLVERKGRGTSTRDWVRKLKNMGLVPNSGTVVLRSRSGRRRSSVHAPANFRSAPSSGADSSPASEQSFIENESTGKTSVDSRHSVVANPSQQRRSSRMQYPWLRSSPDFSLGTIEESGLDQFLPTIETVEKAAAVKIFLETQLNEKIHHQNARNIRSNYLETQLYYSPHLTKEQKDVVRASF